MPAGRRHIDIAGCGGWVEDHAVGVVEAAGVGDWLIAAPLESTPRRTMMLADCWARRSLRWPRREDSAGC